MKTRENENINLEAYKDQVEKHSIEKYFPEEGVAADGKPITIINFKGLQGDSSVRCIMRRLTCNLNDEPCYDVGMINNHSFGDLYNLFQKIDLRSYCGVKQLHLEFNATAIASGEDFWDKFFQNLSSNVVNKKVSFMWYKNFDLSAKEREEIILMAQMCDFFKKVLFYRDESYLNQVYVNGFELFNAENYYKLIEKMCDRFNYLKKHYPAQFQFINEDCRKTFGEDYSPKTTLESIEYTLNKIDIKYLQDETCEEYVIYNTVKKIIENAEKEDTQNQKNDKTEEKEQENDKTEETEAMENVLKEKIVIPTVAVEETSKKTNETINKTQLNSEQSAKAKRRIEKLKHPITVVTLDHHGNLYQGARNRVDVFKNQLTSFVSEQPTAPAQISDKLKPIELPPKVATRILNLTEKLNPKDPVNKDRTRVANQCTVIDDGQAQALGQFAFRQFTTNSSNPGVYQRITESPASLTEKARNAEEFIRSHIKKSSIFSTSSNTTTKVPSTPAPVMLETNIGGNTVGSRPSQVVEAGGLKQLTGNTKLI